MSLYFLGYITSFFIYLCIQRLKPGNLNLMDFYVASKKSNFFKRTKTISEPKNTQVWVLDLLTISKEPNIEITKESVSGEDQLWRYGRGKVDIIENTTFNYFYFVFLVIVTRNGKWNEK